MFQLCVVAVGQVDVCADLLERSNPLHFVEGEVLDWADETCGRCADENYWVYCVFEMAFFHVGDLCLFGNDVAFDFQDLQRIDEIVGFQCINVPSMIAVDHNGVAVDILDIVVILKRYHSIFHTDIVDVFVVLLVESFVSQWAAADCDVV